MKHLLQEDQQHDALDDAKGLSRLLTHLAEQEDVNEMELFADTEGFRKKVRSIWETI